MAWFLRCTNNGQYSGMFVAYGGGQSSYTMNILKAQRFSTKEDAQASACGNEVPFEYTL